MITFVHHATIEGPISSFVVTFPNYTLPSKETLDWIASLDPDREQALGASFLWPCVPLTQAVPSGNRIVF